MKKRGMIFGKCFFLMCIFLFSLIVFSQFILAADNNSLTATDATTAKVDKAYDCLKNKISGKCDKLNTEEKIFSLLALHECKNDLILDSSGEECWPRSKCNIKTTAQAVLALNEVNTDTEKGEKWLITHNATPSDIDWFLEIESSEATTCTIKYPSSSATYTIKIGADKKIDRAAGTCLPLSVGGYWLRVEPSCYNDEIKITCNKGFFTTLLFKKKATSSFDTLHVSGEINSESANGTTTEKVDSYCFSNGGGSCDYEGSLWAALVLDSLDYDISLYMPYLVTMAEDNEKFIPEAFLYLLTGYSDLQSNLFTAQKTNHWTLSGDEYYDTAVALYPFQYESPPEKGKAQEWLLEKQSTDGCWNGIRNTAFILYSTWYRPIANEVADEEDCVDKEYFCMSKIDCEGKVFYEYDCSGTFVCCDTEKKLETCTELNGARCNSNEGCVGGTKHETSDLESGETCCVGGVCEVPKEESDCESAAGTCRTYECNADEQESLETCDFGDICCVTKKVEEKKSYWFIWVLLLLIFLIVLGIVFKDKLIPLWIKMKTKFSSKFPNKGGIATSPRGPGGPRFPPSGMVPNRNIPPQRRILPPVTPQRSLPSKPIQKSQKPGDIDDVLKRLREMGK